MSDLNEIITEMSSNISNVLTDSLKKILKREEDTKTCLFHIPQIQSIINENKNLKNNIQKYLFEKKILIEENLKLQKILEKYGEVVKENIDNAKDRINQIINSHLENNQYNNQYNNSYQENYESEQNFDNNFLDEENFPKLGAN